MGEGEIHVSVQRSRYSRPPALAGGEGGSARESAIHARERSTCVRAPPPLMHCIRNVRVCKGWLKLFQRVADIWQPHKPHINKHPTYHLTPDARSVPLEPRLLRPRRPRRPLRSWCPSTTLVTFNQNIACPVWTYHCYCSPRSIITCASTHARVRRPSQSIRQSIRNAPESFK